VYFRSKTPPLSNFVSIVFPVLLSPRTTIFTVEVSIRNLKLEEKSARTGSTYVYVSRFGQTAGSFAGPFA
jgi:hypothetical protein